MSKHPFIDGYAIYIQIVCVVLGVFALYAHLFWQGGAAIAVAAMLFFLDRWIDRWLAAKLKGVQPAETISLVEAMKDEEE
jgi:hypothetical protein